MFYSVSIVILLENSLENIAKLAITLIFNSCNEGPLFSRQYVPFLEVARPAPSIPCHNTKENTIKQLLHYQDVFSCDGGAHYYVMQETRERPLMAAMLINGHYKEASKLKL